jgi:hypothetical protein
MILVLAKMYQRAHGTRKEEEKNKNRTEAILEVLASFLLWHQLRS